MLQSSKKVSPVKKLKFSSFAAFILSVSLLVASPSYADDIIQKMTYSVYASGINAVEASMTIEPDTNGHYKIFTKASTRGFLGKLVPWSGTFETNGWVLGDHKNSYQPERHASSAIWRGETETKEYKYNKDGSFKGLFITEHNKTTEKKELDHELTDQSTDVLSAALAAMRNVSNGKPCTTDAEVFDGKRRFKMMIKQQRQETLKASRYNIFGGTADRCTVEVTPEGGEWHKKPRGWFSIQEQGREKGTMPTIWFGKVKDEQPAIPVKVMVKTDYGALVMHLIGYEYGETKLVLKD